MRGDVVGIGGGNSDFQTMEKMKMFQLCFFNTLISLKIVTKYWLHLQNRVFNSQCSIYPCKICPDINFFF